MDIGWGTGGTLDVPLENGANAGVLTIRIADGTCDASIAPASVLPVGGLAAVTDAVCVAWVAEGSPAIVPAGPGGPRTGGAPRPVERRHCTRYRYLSD